MRAGIESLRSKSASMSGAFRLEASSGESSGDELRKSRWNSPFVCRHEMSTSPQTLAEWSVLEIESRAAMFIVHPAA